MGGETGGAAVPPPGAAGKGTPGQGATPKKGTTGATGVTGSSTTATGATGTAGPSAP